MRFLLPSSRLGLHLLLGFAAWAGLSQPAMAQSRPTSEVLRARNKPVAKAAAAKAATKIYPRLDSELQRLTAEAGNATASELHASHPHLHFGQHAGRPTVLVRITAKDVNALLPKLQSQGFEVVTSYPKLHFVEGMLPIHQLAAADALSSSGLLGIMASFEPESDGGLVTSQADYVLEADRARATRPRQITGTGVTIGVLSDSFNYLGGAATDVATGDLPAAGVRVLVDNGSTDEGRAMCQLIYDLAPGAAQVFSTANGGEGTFAQHIRDLASTAGGSCKVIVDDVRYFTEPFFQDGVIAQAVTDVVSTLGVAYFASAGNYADKSYETTTPQFVANAGGVRCLNFDVSGATTDLTQRVTIPNGGTFYPVLQWSDPFYTTAGVQTDLNMYLLGVRSNGTVDTVYRSNARNLLTQTPIEPIFFSNSTASTGTTTFDLVITWKAGAAPTRLKYVNRGSVTASEWFTSSHTSYGHSSAAEAFAVAAVPYYNQRVPESFTSKAGPITYLFSPTGAPLSTPVVRQKPNIASIDGTSTTFFGSDYEGDGFPNFFGTSAAAPHAAAVAALLRSSEPALTPAQVYSRLVGSARLIGTSATDPYTGPGLLDAFTALYGPVAAATPPLAEDLEKGALPVSWNVNGYGAARPQVSTLAPASGVQSLILDAYPEITSVFSLNEATLFLQGATASNLQLTFRERKFRAETDEPMPTQFTGRSNTDGVALSVDGGTVWYRIFDLTGTNATTTFQTKSVDLTAFATANALTLGNDIRIKFQQYGRGGATAAVVANRTGRAFDDIVVGSRSPAPTPLYTYSQPTSGCPGLRVQYADSSLFRPTTWAWTFAGGTPATSTLPNPTVIYNMSGRYGLTLSVSNAAGTTTRTDTSIVVVSGGVPANPFAENFNATPALPIGWTFVTPPPASPWVLANGIVGRTGTVSRTLRTQFTDDIYLGSHPAVYTPALNLSYSGAANPTLRFDVAYRPYASVVGGAVTADDSLIVQIVNACTGAVLGRPYAKSALATLPTTTSGPGFVPTAADWRQETVSLTPYIGNSIIIRFVGRNGHGNYLYLDNVQINDGVLSMASAANAVGFDAWPNPTPSGTALTLRLPAFNGGVSLRLVDALGRVVWQDVVKQTGVALERTLRPGLAPGLYNLLYVPVGGISAARRIVLE